MWVYYNYTTLTLLKTAKLLFLKGKRVKCWRFHTAGVTSSKLVLPTKNSRLKKHLREIPSAFLFCQAFFASVEFVWTPVAQLQ